MKVEKCTVYIANDGARFSTECACIKYEHGELITRELQNLLYQKSTLTGSDCKEVAELIWYLWDDIKQIVESSA